MQIIKHGSIAFRVERDCAKNMLCIIKKKPYVSFRRRCTNTRRARDPIKKARLECIAAVHFVSPLKELAAINERSGWKSNWEIPAACTLGLPRGAGRGREGGDWGHPDWTYWECVHTYGSTKTFIERHRSPSPSTLLLLSSLLIVAINGARLINCATGP